MQDRLSFVDYTTSSSTPSGDMSNYYTKAQVNALVAADNASLIQKSELELAFKQAYETEYKEPVYDGNVLTQINIYSNSSKDMLLFSKVFSRVNGVLSSIVIVDEISGKTLTKNYSFVNGQWAYTNKVFGG